tara:strand:+ start:292 stop:510 length:219 start_codon:yes stop_codon:yes gene_type:complete
VGTGLVIQGQVKLVAEVNQPTNLNFEYYFLFEVTLAVLVVELKNVVNLPQREKLEERMEETSQMNQRSLEKL